MTRSIAGRVKLWMPVSSILIAFLTVSGCETTKKFAEGTRVMTGQGGTKEELDTIVEIVPDEIGFDDTRYENYVKFKFGMPYPSVLSYNLARLQIRDAIWDDSNLVLAASSGELERVKTLLKNGAWVNSRDVLGGTASTARRQMGLKKSRAS